jgi:hypothetical protein
MSAHRAKPLDRDINDPLSTGGRAGVTGDEGDALAAGVELVERRVQAECPYP